MTSPNDGVPRERDNHSGTTAAFEHAEPMLANPSRRQALGMLCALSAAIATGCSSESDATGSSIGAAGQGSAPAACVESPTEDAGPYVDKTDMLDETEFYRSDVTENKPGLPFTLSFSLVDRCLQ